MGRVSGKVAVVTGAAQGIGRAIAAMLAREGAHVVLADLQVAAAQEVASGIQAGGGSASAALLDVSVEAHWQRLIDDVLVSHGALHILVNSAGIAFSGNVAETTLEDWRRVQSINLDGTFLGLKYAIPALAGSGGGSIVNISSVEGIVADPDMAAYDASKGGVRLLTKSAALYCGQARSGIRVNSVHPSFVRGPLTDAYLQAQPDPAGLERELEAAHPIGRLGEPDDIAYAVLYLASDEASWVTGSELVIDGGWTAR